MTAPIELCALSDIVDGQAKGFTFGSGLHQLNVLVARQGNQAFAYVNSCPHVGTPLDWQPDRFMSVDGLMLQCATHGARFLIENGLCIHGPCKGESLQPLTLQITDGQISIYLPYMPLGTSTC